MKNPFLTFLACAAHVFIHQMIRYCGILNEDANRNLLYLMLSATFATSLHFFLKPNTNE